MADSDPDVCESRKSGEVGLWPSYNPTPIASRGDLGVDIQTGRMTSFCKTKHY